MVSALVYWCDVIAVVDVGGVGVLVYVNGVGVVGAV